MKTQRGFMSTLVLIVIMFGLIVVGGGTYFVVQQNSPTPTLTENNFDSLPTPSTQTTGTTATNPAPTTQTQPAKTQPAPIAQSAKEISFTTPTGYHVEEDWYAKQDSSWSQASGIDKHFMFLSNERWERWNTGPATGGPASITISFYRNPQNLTVQQWLEMRGEVAEGSSSYSFKDRTSVRYTPSPGQHYYDAVVVRHKNWIVLIHNANDGPTDTQNQVFEQLLASITFAQ